MAAETPAPLFFAVAPTGLIVAMPETVPVAAENVLRGHLSALELVGDEDLQPMIEAWESAVRYGQGAVSAHLATDPSREITLQFVDARARFGVLLGAVFGLSTDAPLTPRPQPMGPRVAHVLKDERAVVVGVDRAFTRLLGWTEAELVGRRVLEIVHPDDRVRAIANWMGMLQAPDEEVRVRLRHQHADGSWVWFEVTNFHRLGDPAYGDILGEMVEIADEMVAEEALRTRNQLLQLLTESLPLGVAQLDAQRRITLRNERLDTMLGASADRLDEQLAGLGDGGRAEVLGAVERALSEGVDVDVEADLAASGLRCAFVVRPLQDSQGSVNGAVLTVTDITESGRLRDQLERRATFDGLTGCRNRMAVFAELGARLASPGGTGSVAAVFVDLDRFKAVNDRLGHAAGDRVLVATAERLLATVRGGDVVGRLGGDEFLVVSSALASPAEAMGLARRVVEALACPVQIGGEELVTTASVGVAWTNRRIDPDELVAAADLAMYAAKKARDGRPVLADVTARREA
jgi:diguanylate cyclase (GGDEF)-like protein/PAS domain S-box-containing protein